MNKGGQIDKAECHAEIDRELFGRLFSAGFTILGLGLPVMAGALVALRNAKLSTLLGDELRRLVWLLLPAIVICTNITTSLPNTSWIVKQGSQDKNVSTSHLNNIVSVSCSRPCASCLIQPLPSLPGIR